MQGWMVSKGRDSTDTCVHSLNAFLVPHKLNTNSARHLLPSPGSKTPTVQVADID